MENVIALMVQMSRLVSASDGWQIQIVFKRPHLATRLHQLLGELSPMG